MIRGRAAVKLLGLGLVLVTPWAGAHDQAPEARLVLGMYSVPAEACSLVAAAGFTTIHTYDLENRTYANAEEYCDAAGRYLDTALRHDLKVLVGVPRTWLVQRREQRLRVAIRTLRHHPALLAWYEEEIAQGGDIGAVGFLDRIVQQEDPEHGLVIEEARLDRRLLTIGRARMFTYYPVTPTSRIRRRLQPLPARFPVWQLERPFWPALQAFGQDSMVGLDKPRWVLPRRLELRYSLYSAMVAGAQGVFFYPYFQATVFDEKLKSAGEWPYKNYRPLPEFAPKLWRDVCATANEAAVLLELTSRGIPSKMFDCSLFPDFIESQEWSIPDGLLLLLANPRHEPLTLRIPAPNSAGAFASLHGEHFAIHYEMVNGVLELEMSGPGGTALVFR
jgi:hypothetical protein